MLSTLHDNIGKMNRFNSGRLSTARHTHINNSTLYSSPRKRIHLNCVSPLLLCILFIFPYHAQTGVSAEMFPDGGTAVPDESNILVVELDQDHCHKADIIAKRYGYMNHGNVVYDCTFEFEHAHSNERRKRQAVESLGSDLRVRSLEKQRVLKRVKRKAIEFTNSTVTPSTMITSSYFEPQWPAPTLPFPDPLYSDQWYLTGVRPAPNNMSKGADMGVMDAWQMGFAGRGVVTSIIDDGILPSHPDLKDNYDPMASTDINGRDDDPTPRNNAENRHGTRCAGEVAAVADNDICGVGIAYLSKVGGVRMLDGMVTDSVEARSLGHRQDHVDIYCASWGPDDDGRTFDGPGPLTKEAFHQGITHGRGGNGNIFIWASGNGGAYYDSCSADGYTTSIYTLSISSATSDNTQPWYLEECPCSIATTYSSGGPGQPAIVTVDMPDGCTKLHTGTSASAPIAAGIVALALEANANLTWRDIQHLVLRTSDPVPLMGDTGWATNGAGRLVSHKFGYGLMHAGHLVEAALTWQGVPEQHMCTYDYDTENGQTTLQGKFVENFSLRVSSCAGTKQVVNYLEHVQVVASVTFSRRGALKISLTSPLGTTAVLLPQRRRDNNRAGFHKWAFMSVHHWGENPTGVWNLTVENTGSGSESGTIYDWSLVLYGTATAPGVDEMIDQSAREPNVTLASSSIDGELESDISSNTIIPLGNPVSEKARHFFLSISCEFCVTILDFFLKL